MRALLTKKIQFEKEKSKIRCLLDSIKFIKGLIEFDCKKNYFLKSIWALIGRN